MSSRLCVAQTHSITWEGLPPVRAGGVQQAGTHSTPVFQENVPQALQPDSE